MFNSGAPCGIRVLPVFGESKSFTEYCTNIMLQLFILSVDHDNNDNNLCVIQDATCVLPCNSGHKYAMVLSWALPTHVI